MRKLISASILTLLLTGCVTTGTKIDPTVVSSFQPGVTTLEQAEAKLGQPNSVTKQSDGSTTAVYTFAHGQASGSSYIPVVGAFVGHSDVQSQITELSFDKNGKYVRSSVTNGQTSTGMN